MKAKPGLTDVVMEVDEDKLEIHNQVIRENRIVSFIRVPDQNL